MMLTLQQAADQLGKSVRQVRYLIKRGQILTTKAPRPTTSGASTASSEQRAGQEAARERKQEHLKDAVDEVLSLPVIRRKRYSVKDLRAFRIAAPLYQQAVT